MSDIITGPGPQTYEPEEGFKLKWLHEILDDPDFQESLKIIMQKKGWTPPEPEWTPKEGELVLLHIKPDRWAAISYNEYMHMNSLKRGFVKPHPTHLCWETGTHPLNERILVDSGADHRIYVVRAFKQIADVNRWARLPLEEE